MIDLLVLIAVHGIVEEEREVGDQVEVVADAVRLILRQRLTAAVAAIRRRGCSDTCRRRRSGRSMPKRSMSPPSTARCGEASVAFHSP